MVLCLLLIKTVGFITLYVPLHRLAYSFFKGDSKFTFYLFSLKIRLECANLISPCGLNEACINTAASYECSCQEGFQENKEGICEGIKKLKSTS